MAKRSAVVAGTLVLALGVGFVAGWVGHQPPQSHVTSPSTTRVVIPNVVGLRTNRATVVLHSLGLQEHVSTVSTGTYRAGYIVQQIPMAGAEVDAGATVLLGVSPFHWFAQNVPIHTLPRIGSSGARP